MADVIQVVCGVYLDSSAEFLAEGVEDFDAFVQLERWLFLAEIGRQIKTQRFQLSQCLLKVDYLLLGILST